MRASMVLRVGSCISFLGVYLHSDPLLTVNVIDSRPSFLFTVPALRSWSPASLKPRARRFASALLSRSLPLASSHTPRSPAPPRMRSSSLGSRAARFFGRPKTLGAENGKGETDVHHESIDAHRLHRTGCRNSLHVKWNAGHHAVDRHQ